MSEWGLPGPGLRLGHILLGALGCWPCGLSCGFSWELGLLPSHRSCGLVGPGCFGPGAGGPEGRACGCQAGGGLFGLWWAGWYGRHPYLRVLQMAGAN